MNSYHERGGIRACMSLVSDISKYASLATRNMAQAPLAGGASPLAGEGASQEIT
jgi:hypothetical protein